MALLGGNLSKWGGMLYIEYITGLLTVHGWHSVFPHLTTGGVGARFGTVALWDCCPVEK